LASELRFLLKDGSGGFHSSVGGDRKGLSLHH
jgi:hypothetical protein